jgi:hypothetical protein
MATVPMVIAAMVTVTTVTVATAQGVARETPSAFWARWVSRSTPKMTTTTTTTTTVTTTAMAVATTAGGCHD